MGAQHHYSLHSLLVNLSRPKTESPVARTFSLTLLHIYPSQRLRYCSPLNLTPALLYRTLHLHAHPCSVGIQPNLSSSFACCSLINFWPPIYSLFFHFPDRLPKPLPRVVIDAFSPTADLTPPLVVADPHPGNLLVTGDGMLVYLDFGMMSELPQRYRIGLIRTVSHRCLVLPNRLSLSGCYVPGLLPRFVQLCSVPASLRCFFAAVANCASTTIMLLDIHKTLLYDQLVMLCTNGSSMRREIFGSTPVETRGLADVGCGNQPSWNEDFFPSFNARLPENHFRSVVRMSRSKSTLIFLQLVHFVNKDAIGLARDFVTLGFLPPQTGTDPIRTLIVHSSD